MAILEGSLGAIEACADALWVGAGAGFAFSSPITFHLVEDRDVFSQITGQTLDRLTRVAYVAASVAAGAAFVRSVLGDGSRENDLARASANLAAICLFRYHQRAIVPAMAETQRSMGGFREVAEDDPRRIAYRALHKRSTRVFGGALLLGMGALALAAFRAVD
ncbi:MAG TPA: hypothetical protein VMA36_01340 [Candidatus Limnocylindria bacterium]|jgi:hypothetical protein|nr:hypothetical protein [Candidatus Limnocylindria bacterium]